MIKESAISGYHSSCFAGSSFKGARFELELLLEEARRFFLFMVGQKIIWFVLLHNEWLFSSPVMQFVSGSEFQILKLSGQKVLVDGDNSERLLQNAVRFQEEKHTRRSQLECHLINQNENGV